MRVLAELAAAVMVLGGGWLSFKAATTLLRPNKWTTEPRSIEAGPDAGKNAVFLVKGDREVQVGKPFDPNDEMALDERLLDARRMKKDL